MTEAGTTPVTARLAYGTEQQLAALRPLVKAERARARALAKTPQWDWDGLPGREAAAKRAQWAMYRAHLRESGELADTLDALVASGVRAELAARRWDRDWPPLPAQARNPGRWPGTRDGGWPEPVTVRLPAALVNQVLAACRHTSGDTIGRLRDWRDAHPDILPTKPFRYPEEDAALAEYEQLAAQVTPAGRIWRPRSARHRRRAGHPRAPDRRRRGVSVTLG